MTVEELFLAFEKKKVLVVGDVMIDAYIFGSTRTSDPTPILNEKRREKRLGGAANVALNVKALGATPILCSLVGDDYDGKTFEKLLDEQGMPNKGIIRSQNRKTTKKLRVLSGANQVVQVDSEDIHPLIDLDRKSLLNHINDLSAEADLIIFEDYDKGTIHAEIISETISIAKRKGIPVAVDPKSKNFFLYEGVNLFKPRISELEKYVSRNLVAGNEDQLKESIENLHSKIKADNYLVSLDGGDIYYHSSKSSSIFSTHHRGIADMSGVGNAIISIAGLGLTLGLKEEAIAEISNIAAGIVAQYSGVVPLSKDQVLKAAAENQLLQKFL